MDTGAGGGMDTGGGGGMDTGGGGGIASRAADSAASAASGPSPRSRFRAFFAALRSRFFSFFNRFFSFFCFLRSPRELGAGSSSEPARGRLRPSPDDPSESLSSDDESCRAIAGRGARRVARCSWEAGGRAGGGAARCGAATRWASLATASSTSAAPSRLC